MLAANALDSQTISNARIAILAITVVIFLFWKRLFYLLARVLIILLAVAFAVGAVSLVQMLHG